MMRRRQERPLAAQYIRRYEHNRVAPGSREAAVCTAVLSANSATVLREKASRLAIAAWDPQPAEPRIFKTRLGDEVPVMCAFKRPHREAVRFPSL